MPNSHQLRANYLTTTYQLLTNSYHGRCWLGGGRERVLESSFVGAKKGLLQINFIKNKKKCIFALKYPCAAKVHEADFEYIR